MEGPGPSHGSRRFDNDQLRLPALARILSQELEPPRLERERENCRNLDMIIDLCVENKCRIGSTTKGMAHRLG